MVFLCYKIDSYQYVKHMNFLKYQQYCNSSNNFSGDNIYVHQIVVKSHLLLIKSWTRECVLSFTLIQTKRYVRNSPKLTFC